MRWEKPVEPVAPQQAPSPLRRRRTRRAKGVRLLLSLVGCVAIVALAGAGVRSLALGEGRADALHLAVTAPTSGQVTLLGAKTERRLGFVTVTGSVANRSAHAQSHVEAVVELLDAHNRTLQLESSLVSFDPLDKGETAPFRVELADDSHAVGYRIHFRQLLGPRLD
jgi:hypothetical protein